MGQSIQSSRATSIEELDTIMEKFWNLEAGERGLAFQPRPTDIIISPYAKCGTTWLQQIAQSLRSRGDMSFDEITAVTPWIEIAYDVGWDLDADHLYNPRVFKTHLTWYDVPKGGRYICSFRHYNAAVVSLFRFFEGWYVEPDSIDIETFIRNWRWPREKMGEQGYWYHLASWWEQRKNPNVLLFCYEDMLADAPSTIQRIAKFMEIALDDKLFDIVLQQSSREHMLKYPEKYDAHHIAEVGGKRANLPPAIDTAKVTIGTPDKAKYRLSAEMKDYLDSIWKEQIGDKLGLETYDDLRQAVRELHA